MATKYYIGMAVGIISCVLFGLSIGLPVLTFDGTTKTTSAYFRSCTGSNPCVNPKDQTTCSETKKALDAGRAFSIMATIFSGLLCFIFGSRIAQPLVYLAIAPIKIVMYLLLACALIAGVLDWIVGFAIFGAEFCGSKIRDQANANVGASAPLAFVGSVLILVQIIIECCMADASLVDAASDSSAPDADNSNNKDKKDDAAPSEVVATSSESKKEEQSSSAAAVAPVAATAAVAASSSSSKKDDEKKKEDTKKAAAPAKKKSKPEINWKEINAKLPYEKKNKAQRERRFAMFDKIDGNKSGKVSLAEVSAGMETVLGLGDKIDVPVVIKTAFDKARVAGGTDSGAGGDFIEKNEFRVFLMYTRMYFEMYQLFDELDESGDMMVELSEFEKAIPLLKTWGAKIDNAAETFKKIDTNGAGKVSFAEFADWALSPEQNLDCPEDDE